MQDPVSCGELIDADPHLGDQTAGSKEWQPVHENCLWLPFSGQAAGRPLDAFTATEQKTRGRARGGLVAAATLQKGKSASRGWRNTLWPTRQWT